MEPGRLRVETLGPLRAYAGGRELFLGPPKQRVVFAALALSGNSAVSRDALIDHLWGERPPATAAGSLHTYVSGLRRSLAGLGEPLSSAGSAYTLRLDPEWLDVRLVERDAARARSLRARRRSAAAVAALDEALARWRSGPPLDGLSGPLVTQHRAWASELRLRLAMERAEILLELGRAGDVADQLWEQLAANPFHEQLCALLMTALRQTGRTAAALREYHALRQRLADDLGIDPSPELRELYSTILADTDVDANGRADDFATANTKAHVDAVAAAKTEVGVDGDNGVGSDDNAGSEAHVDTAGGETVPAQLPRGVGTFVGRAADVRRVVDAARAVPAGTDGYRSPRIMMMVGVGGVGKTALAVHCAHLLAAEYPDGALYVNLRGFDPRHRARTPADALHHLLGSLGVTKVPTTQEGRVALWRSIVADKRLLIVLDNAESADQVDDLLPGGGPSFVVVTSRNRLSGLAIRYSAGRVSLPTLTDDESIQLLRFSIGDARVAAELPAARRLVRLCDRLPLALRIAAEQVTARPRSRIADLIDDLQDVQGRLDALQLPDDELYSVRGVLTWSYARLAADAAHAFRMLAIFPGVGVGRHVVAALLDVSLPEAASLLGRLAAQHLVETDGASYWMHDLTRIYAAEVSREGEPARARRQGLERVLEWYVRTLAHDPTSSRAKRPFALDVETRHQPLSFENQTGFVLWCTREWDNIRPLVRAAQRIGRHDRAWQLVNTLFSYFYAAGHARSWVEMLRIGIHSTAMVSDRIAEAALRNHLSVAYSRMGRNEDAVGELKHGLRLLAALGDDPQRISLLANLASTLREAKDYPAALRYARQALELARRIGSDYYQVGCLDTLCELHAEVGDFEDSLRYGRPGLALARRSRSVLLEANLLTNLGVAEHGSGNAEAAERYFRDAVSLCAADGDRYHEALAQFGLARVHRAGSDRRAARELATRALRRLRGLDAEEVAEVSQFLRALDDPAPAPAPARAG